jgi:hypothetical protein
MKHLEAYRHIHATNPNYGQGSGVAVCDAIRNHLPTELTTRPHSAMDWGCGRSKMLFNIFPNAQTYFRYDPAIREFHTFPEESYPRLIMDFGLCTDVLEHIPDDELADTFHRMDYWARRWIFIVCTRPAGQLLPNGENAHCSVYPAEWWLERLRKVWPAARRADFSTPENRPGFLTF